MFLDKNDPKGPELDRQSGTFVDTESEVRAKRSADCLPIGGSQIDAAFSKRILISKLEVQGRRQITSIEAAGQTDRASDLRMGRQLEINLLSV
jgi:hypothetical protein